MEETKLWEHEERHVADTRCPPCGVGVAIIDDRVQQFSGELSAWNVTRDCLLRALNSNECRGSRTCERMLGFEISNAEMEISSYQRRLNAELQRRRN